MSSDNINHDDVLDSDRTFWQNTTSYHGSSKILLVTIISFSIIIIIVFTYHLYDRFVLRRRRGSSSAFQDGLSNVTHPPPKHGLDALTMASLPTFVVEVNAVDLVSKECTVCLSLFEEKDRVRMLPNCKHVFHVACVDTWLTTQSTCPICRSEVEPTLILEPEPREGPVSDNASLTDPRDNKMGESSVSRFENFRKISTTDTYSNINDSSRGDRLDLERQ
ncbi:unnamed protein product [Cochlearia groenlandica]